jgi:transketolase
VLLQVYDTMRGNVSKGAAAEEQWKGALATYKQKYPKEAEEFEGLIR